MEETKDNQQPKEDKQTLQLKRSFTFWFVSTKSGQNRSNYQDLLKKVGTFNNVEDFWSYYQHMVRPDAMPEGSQFNLFQEGIEPMWESEANKNGGRYILRIKKKFANRFWEDIILGFIGEQCDDSDFLNGLILQIKNTHTIISLWIKDIQKNRQREQNIRSWIIRTLGVNENTQIEYKDHPREGEEEKQEHKQTDDNKKNNKYKKNSYNSYNNNNTNQEKEQVIEEKKSEDITEKK